MTFEPAGEGTTNFRWRVYYTPSWIVRPMLGVLQRGFEQLFRHSTERLAAFFRDRPRREIRSGLRRPPVHERAPELDVGVSSPPAIIIVTGGGES